MQTTTTIKSTVDQLNSFLRGELAAVETYRQAIVKLENSSNRWVLEQCARSHEERATLLSREVQRLGGAPPHGSGAWGTFAKLIEGSAQIFGEKAAIAALEEGEDHGKSDYQRDVAELDPSARALVEARVLPEQLRTHSVMSALKKSLS